MTRRRSKPRKKSRAGKRKASRQHARRMHTSSTSSSDSFAPQRRFHRSPFRETSEDKAAIAILHRGIMPNIRERPELGDYASTQAEESARALFRFGWNSSDSVKNAKAPSRSHFLSLLDVRREIGYRPPSSIYDLFGVPIPPKRGRNLKEVEFADVSIPLALDSYRDPLSRV